MKTFRNGLVDALPVFFGYLSVGFAFALCAKGYGHPAWSPLLLSATHISGTGQFAVINQLHAGAGLWGTLLAVVALNLRYILMAFAVAQRLDPGIGTWKRLLVAMGDTDEIVGIAIRCETISFRYYMGLLVCSAAGWMLGTALGVSPAIAAILPRTLVGCLGLALYAMFCAIIIPGARDSRPMLLCVVLAAIASIGLRLLPHGPGGGWITLIAGVSSAVVAAILFPKDPIPAKETSKEGGA